MSQLNGNTVPKQAELSDEQRNRIKQLWNPERETLNECIQRVINRGLSAIEQQKTSYEKGKEDAKLARKALKYVKSNPEAAIAMGLAHRGDGSTGVQRVG